MKQSALDRLISDVKLERLKLSIFHLIKIEKLIANYWQVNPVHYFIQLFALLVWGIFFGKVIINLAL